MKQFWKNYGQSILLILGIIAGGCVGMYFPQCVPYLKPVGDMFLNMIFVLVVPLVFLSMAHAVYHLARQNSAGKQLGKTGLVFLQLGIVTALIGYVGCMLYAPLGTDCQHILGSSEKQNTGELIVKILSVPDFYLMLDKDHLIPLLLFSILIGFAAGKIGDKSLPLMNVLDSAYQVVMRLFEIIMVVGPIGLGCYFSSVMADMGGGLMMGYLRSMLLFVVGISVLLLIVNPLLVWLRCGKQALLRYLRAIVAPSMTAVATCSSSICLPISIRSTKESGVDEDIAEMVIPLGINVFRQASVVECCIKVWMALTIAGLTVSGIENMLLIIGVGMLASCLVTSVPGGGMTSEAIICSLLGVSPQIVGILVVFAVIIDMPATVGNVVGNITAATLVQGRPKH